MFDCYALPDSMGTAQLPARANIIMISILSYHRGMPDAIFVFEFKYSG